jgi:predicted transcriptional regulator YheO
MWLVVTYTKLDDGRLLKSVTMLVRNIQGNPIGQQCINIDLSVPLLDFIRKFLPKDSESYEEAIEHLPRTLNELAIRTLETVMTCANSRMEFLG